MFDYQRHNFKKPSLQLRIPLGLDQGEADVKNALAWIDNHPIIWELLIKTAIREARHTKFVSMRDLASWVRIQYHVSISNNITPALARIAENNFPALQGKFKSHKSNCDGYV